MVGLGDMKREHRPVADSFKPRRRTLRERLGIPERGIVVTIIGDDAACMDKNAAPTEAMTPDELDEELEIQLLDCAAVLERLKNAEPLRRTGDPWRGVA